MDATTEDVTAPAAEELAPAAPVPAAMSKEAREFRDLKTAMVKFGHWTAAEGEAREAAHLGGTDPKSTVADPLAAAELDPVFDRPASPDSYRFPPVTSGDISAKELQAMQLLAFQARLPQSIATELFHIADSYAGRRMSETDIAVLTKTTNAQLDRHYGAERDAKVDLANRLISDVLKVNPSLEALLRCGVGSDYGFVSHVIEHAARVYRK